MYNYTDLKLDNTVLNNTLTMPNINAEEASSDYIYENDKGSTSSTTHHQYVNVDDYVLPPQDRNHALEIRPRKAEKGNENDMYDNDTLARHSGFGKKLVNSLVHTPSGPNDRPVQRKLKWTSIIILCLIVVAMLGFVGGLAYTLIDRIGKPLNQGFTYYNVLYDRHFVLFIRMYLFLYQRSAPSPMETC